MQTRSRVMIVEDNPADIMLIRQGIKKCEEDYDCYYFSDGEEAINYLYSAKAGNTGKLPDAIIIDLNLPGKNGMEILREVRSDSTFTSIPIAIFSSMPYGNTLKKSDDKADMYYSKPFDVEEYLEMVCRICTELDKLKKSRE